MSVNDADFIIRLCEKPYRRDKLTEARIAQILFATGNYTRSTIAQGMNAEWYWLMRDAWAKIQNNETALKWQRNNRDKWNECMRRRSLKKVLCATLPKMDADTSRLYFKMVRELDA